jgi:putative restriction endonuclease
VSGAAVLQRFERINTWKRGDQRAPHKPLLILYALGRWQRGLKEVTFREAEPELKKLLQKFGRPRKSDHPEQPFWRLQRNKVWVVHAPANMPLKPRKDIPLVGALRSPEVRAEFTPDVQAALTADPGLVERIAGRVLIEHFPESYHQDILDAVALDARVRRRRDPKFRGLVLDAYENKCAVCGFYLWVDDVLTALDAAHIRWHQAGGPDTEQNGLALCAMHHRLFDYGAFTVRDGRVVVSTKAIGEVRFHEYLMAFHGEPIRPPQSPEHRPDPAHFEWHGREVFKGKPRHVG